MKLRGQTRLARADGRRAVAQVRDECKAARARLIEDARARRVSSMGCRGAERGYHEVSETEEMTP